MSSSFPPLPASFPRTGRWSPPSQPRSLQLLPPVRMCADAADPAELLTLSDLRAGAVHLATRFQHNPIAAKLVQPEWYREQWGEELCNPGEALLMREMTIELCEEQRVLQQYLDLGERRERASENLDGAGFVAAMLFLLVVVGWLVKG